MPLSVRVDARWASERMRVTRFDRRWFDRRALVNDAARHGESDVYSRGVFSIFYAVLDYTRNRPTRSNELFESLELTASYSDASVSGVVMQQCSMHLYAGRNIGKISFQTFRSCHCTVEKFIPPIEHRFATISSRLNFRAPAKRLISKRILGPALTLSSGFLNLTVEK